MTARILAAEEWPRLIGTELETVWPYLPAGSRVLVIEDDAAIVGCWALFPQWHVEGIWIAPSHRKHGAVGVRLLRAMRTLARTLGARAVSTAACSGDVESFLKRLGAAEVPGVHFSLPV